MSFIFFKTLLFSAWNVHIRHSLLVRSIGPFDEEIFAYGLALGLAIGFPLALILVSVGNYYIYRMYNRSYHPFHVLVEDYQAPEDIPLQDVGTEGQEP